MQLINRIENTDELKSFRDQVGRVIEKKMGSPLKGRKLDEIAAEFLGAKDFNTAMGLVRMSESIPKGVETFRNTPRSNANHGLNIQAWYSVLLGVVKDEFADEEGVQDMLDDTVYDFVGTTKWVSDNVNNQGWERQVEAIASEMALSQLRDRVFELTGIPDSDLDRCVSQCACLINNDYMEVGSSFGVKDFLMSW